MDLQRSDNEGRGRRAPLVGLPSAGPNGVAPPSAPPTGPVPIAPVRGPVVTSPPLRRLTSKGGRVPAELDASAVEALKRGDRDAWEAAYRAYGKPLMGFLVLRLHDVDDASEALSETFLRSLEKASTFRGDAPAFRAWLYRIARNVAIDRLRARSRVQPVAHTEEQPDIAEPAADQAMIALESASEALAALDSLDPDDREVVWLRVCAGLSAEEVGRIVGKRPGAVRMQQMRSLEALARKVRR